MAFPDLIANNGGGTVANVTTSTLNLPAGIATGDRIIICAAVDQNTGVAFTWPTPTWTAVGVQDNATAIRVEVRYRDVDGSEGWSTGNTITLTHASNMSSHIAVLIDAGTFATGTAPAISFATGSGTTSADPPSLDPSWGAEDTLYLALSANDNGNTTVTAVPTGSGYAQVGTNYRGASTQSTGVAMAEKNSSATSDDPGAFTLSAAEMFITATIGIRGTAGGAAVTDADYFTITRPRFRVWA